MRPSLLLAFSATPAIAVDFCFDYAPAIAASRSFALLLLFLLPLLLALSRLLLLLLLLASAPAPATSASCFCSYYRCFCSLLFHLLAFAPASATLLMWADCAPPAFAFAKAHMQGSITGPSIVLQQAEWQAESAWQGPCHFIPMPTIPLFDHTTV
jgi:hypothetical protein